MEKFGRFFSIRKTYFLQVKRLILVGTLEKCVFLSLKRFRKKRFALVRRSETA
ncbi:hypothetical protein LEP1GSC021_0060 [Leptospira noguchii str. 1993005606]|nr:hypothetical protein LEP1GSC021_0060 [Leptospira noguchii str. 1993005606]